jgi:hypothetical protein
MDRPKASEFAPIQHHHIPPHTEIINEVISNKAQNNKKNGVCPLCSLKVANPSAKKSCSSSSSYFHPTSFLFLNKEENFHRETRQVLF